MDDAERDGGGPRRRSGAGRRIVLAGGALLLAGVLGLWVERRPIAAHVIDRELVRRGVPARYRIEDFGLGRQRLLDVVIGDPRAPDLTADWIEADTHIGLDGTTVTGIHAGHVRARARWRDGRLSLGSIDRLLPAPTGKRFQLPALDLDVTDARARLDLPQGVVSLRIAGSGRLDGGFRGTIGASSEGVSVAGCVVDRAAARVRVSVDRARPRLQGPVRASAVRCGDVHARALASDLALTLGPALDSWTGQARVAVGEVAHPAARLADVTGVVGFNGGPNGTRGVLDLVAAHLAAADASGRALALRGDYLIDRAGMSLGGGSGARLSASEVRVAPHLLGALDRWTGAGAGTPVAPLLRRWTQAARAAGGRFDLAAAFTARTNGGRARVAVSRMEAASASGARARWVSDTSLVWTDRGLAPIAGTLDLGGGGLPVATLRLASPTPGALSGVVSVQPYAADGAALALAPVRFTLASGRGQVATAARVSGPLANGRVDSLTLPVDARWGGGTLTLNPDCGTWSAARVVVASFRLRAPRLAVCPVGSALVRVTDARVSGGARLAGLLLAGSIGSSPLALKAGETVLRLGERSIAARDVAVRIGAPERATRLDMGSLAGSLRNGSLAGEFARAGGQIGTVPLILSQAAGRWSVAHSTLELAGALVVSDTAAQPRFHPLPVRDVTLRLAGSRIEAAGTLFSPGAKRKVADVTITHDLARGTGEAVLDIPGLIFDHALQPDALTPVTFGVIADVKGTITGRGRVAWSDAGVSSTGTFRTAGADLAAAFGPVSGLAGEIRFTDLLGLTSAPDQRITVEQINPGIPVTNGAIRFQALGGTTLRIAGGEWPFAGGRLMLRPTVLDYSTPRPHALTFALSGVDARQFLAQFDFKNLDATGVFDGVLPMVFDESGGRVENGHLAVRQGGGTIAYVGDLGRKNLGFWGDLAFGALKSLKYRSLAVGMNGPLAGEMVTEVRFAGIGEGKGARSNFLIRRLERLPFVFNIRIKAPFRGLIGSAQSFYDPSELVERNLPALIEQQNRATRPIQPSASETKP